jgi:probable rRNA maturation factor
MPVSSRLKIVNETKTRIPRALFAKIAHEILGKDYILDCTVISPAHMQKINCKFRGKNKPTDILSFPYSHFEGEIFLCPAYAKKKAPKFDRTFSNFMIFLFIHGCVHLKGHDHGSTMEYIESKVRRKFGI